MYTHPTIKSARTTTPIAMPAMTGGESTTPVDESGDDVVVGSVMRTAFVVKIVSFRPTIVPDRGCCSHPAWIAVKTNHS
jgi:hypothetical protein